MKIKNLRAFVYVIEEGTLARAAKRLNLSQPAASRLLRLLEQDVGAALFDRHKQRLIPTSVGYQIYSEAVRILASVDGIPNLVQQLQKGQTTPMRIACHLRVIDSVVMPAVTRLASRAPDLRIHLEVQARRNLERLVSQEIFDVGVGVLPVSSDTHLREKLCSTKLQVLVSSQHPLAGRFHITAEDLAPYQYVALTRQTFIRNAIDESFQKAGKHLEPFHEFSTSAAGHQFVAATTAYTITDRYSLGVSLGESVKLLQLCPKVTIDYGLFGKRDAREHAAVGNFVDCIREVTKEIML